MNAYETVEAKISFYPHDAS